MKKCFFAMAIAIAMALTACNLHTYSNGDLDGYWQMTALDSISSGRSRDMITERIFWSVDRKLLLVQDLKGGHTSVFFRFNHSNNTLELSDPHYNIGTGTDSTGADPQLTDVDDIRPFGVNNIPEKFSVEQLSSSEMVLKSETLRLHFIKY